MNKHVRLLLLLLVMLGSSSLARATHLLGGQLSYQYVSVGVPLNGNPTQRYKVTLQLFRDCGGITISPTIPLMAKNTCGSSGSATINSMLTFVPSSSVFGTPYCPSLANNTTCQSLTSPYSNFEQARYEGTIDLPPAAEWILSATNNARPALANIVNANSLDFYWEARLNSSIAANGQVQTIVNSSPQFATLPARFVTWGQEMNINIGANDPEGDSLSFALVDALVACNTPAVYASVGNMITPGAGGTCIIVPGANMPTTYSATYPMASFSIVGNCPVKTLSPYFAFDPTNGNLAFTPISYDATSPETSGKNKYAVVVEVKEWRRIGGTLRLVGSSRRDMIFFVYNCGPNDNPTLSRTMQVNGATYPITQVVPVTRGQSVSVMLQAADANAGQSLIISGNELNVPGVNIWPYSGGLVEVEFTPPASLPTGTYNVTVTATDNACPVKGYAAQAISFRVVSSILKTQNAAPKLVATAFPNPFAERVSFTLSRPDMRTAQTVLIVDQLGRVVDRLTVPAAATAEASVSWQPAASVPAGVYLARFENGQQTVRLLRTRQ